MSIERQDRSPSFRTRQQTVKVNHNSKLLPNDFFPKTLSQSPKKRSDGPPTSAEVLAEWYDRDDSKDKPQNHQFHRLSNRPSTSRLTLCAIQQSSQIQKQRYVAEYYNKLGELKGAKLIVPHKINANPQKTRVKIDKCPLIKVNPQSSENDERKVRLIRSESKGKRARDKTPQSLTKHEHLPRQRRSFRESHKSITKNEVAVGFDGMITFSKFK